MSVVIYCMTFSISIFMAFNYLLFTKQCLNWASVGLHTYKSKTRKIFTSFVLKIKHLFAGDGAGTSVIDVRQWDVPQVAARRTKPHLSHAHLIFIASN